MLRLILNKKGISMIEVLIAIVLTSIGLVTLSSLQDSGWKSMAKADYVGRAAEILHNTLEDYQAKISNECYTPPATDTYPLNTSCSDHTTCGSSTAIRGDVTYTVKVDTVVINADPQSYLVTVTVTWTFQLGGTRSISESQQVSRQDSFKFGC